MGKIITPKIPQNAGLASVTVAEETIPPLQNM
jgi:hypothetical protein